MDDLTPEQRRKNMKHIRSKDTKIEKVLRSALWKEGIRYRKNYRALPGKPDIAITKYRIAVFCDGEFFHGKDWDNGLQEKLANSNNASYWIEKIKRNIARDQEINNKLNELGWFVIRFWGKDILAHPDQCVEKIKRLINERTEEYLC